MGMKAKKIVTFDLTKLIKLLNRALADEWLAYYQYWIGAKVAKGPMRTDVVAELDQHAQEELNHATMLCNRIIQLNGTPNLNPQDWFKISGCGYLVPKDFNVKKILEQNIKGEQCAIDFYNEFLKSLIDKDPVTYDMILKILEDEIMHEQDLENFLEDINLTKK